MGRARTRLIQRMKTSLVLVGMIAAALAAPAARGSSTSDKPAGEKPPVVALTAPAGYDRADAEKIWVNVTRGKYRDFCKKKYAIVKFDQKQLEDFVDIEIKEYRESLSDQEYENALINAWTKAYEKEKEKAPQPSPGPESRPQPPPPEGEGGDSGVSPEVVVWAVGRVMSNFEGAARESGIIAQGIRAGYGVSLRDIEEYGLGGGENSVVRQIERAATPALKIEMTGGRVLGGENSFFRKNLGLPW